MKLIPYPPVNELATRDDMPAQTAMLRGEIIAAVLGTSLMCNYLLPFKLTSAPES